MATITGVRLRQHECRGIREPGVRKNTDVICPLFSFDLSHVC
ncbi:hypothetical protein RRSWK_04427 [Rhodopirellula sp. SWK7]|nr:hypothetical protein RRSWK_04427 [Rhodopirellula sp. SWK7]